MYVEGEKNLEEQRGWPISTRKYSLILLDSYDKYLERRRRKDAMSSFSGPMYTVPYKNLLKRGQDNGISKMRAR